MSRVFVSVHHESTCYAMISPLPVKPLVDPQKLSENAPTPTPAVNQQISCRVNVPKGIDPAKQAIKKSNESAAQQNQPQPRGILPSRLDKKILPPHSFSKLLQLADDTRDRGDYESEIRYLEQMKAARPDQGETQQWKDRMARAQQDLYKKQIQSQRDLVDAAKNSGNWAQAATDLLELWDLVAQGKNRDAGPTSLPLNIRDIQKELKQCLYSREQQVHTLEEGKRVISIWRELQKRDSSSIELSSYSSETELTRCLRTLEQKVHTLEDGKYIIGVWRELQQSGSSTRDSNDAEKGLIGCLVSQANLAAQWGEWQQEIEAWEEILRKTEPPPYLVGVTSLLSYLNEQAKRRLGTAQTNLTHAHIYQEAQEEIQNNNYPGGAKLLIWLWQNAPPTMEILKDWRNV